jgi:hypothetical protein
MTVSVTLVETRTVETGPLYRVKHDITASVHISPYVFVFTTETEAFSRVATVYDIEKVTHTTLAAAQTAGAEFYRLDEVTKNWESLDLAAEFAAYNKQRLQFLVSEYETYTSSFAGTTTTTLTSA